MRGMFRIFRKIKKMVTFSYLNLAEFRHPAPAINTNAMDIVFCRNVLMYFTPDRVRKVVDGIYHSLIDGGWLVVSQGEVSHAAFAQFQKVNSFGTILYQKGRDKPPQMGAQHAAPLPNNEGRFEESHPLASTDVVSPAGLLQGEHVPSTQASGPFAAGVPHSSTTDSPTDFAEIQRLYQLTPIPSARLRAGLTFPLPKGEGTWLPLGEGWGEGKKPPNYPEAAVSLARAYATRASWWERWSGARRPSPGTNCVQIITIYTPPFYKSRTAGWRPPLP